MLTPGAKGAQSDVYTDAVLAELEAAYSSSKMRRTYCWPQVFADGRSYRHYVFALYLGNDPPRPDAAERSEPRRLGVIVICGADHGMRAGDCICESKACLRS
jgi:hypothetical protein